LNNMEKGDGMEEHTNLDELGELYRLLGGIL
jgi:hypothetical protein